MQELILIVYLNIVLLIPKISEFELTKQIID